VLRLPRHCDRGARRAPLRLARAASDPVYGAAARAARTRGPLVALPLERKARVVGVLAVARAVDAREFSDADLSLLVTFADQAGTAVENALLYSQVRAAGEELAWFQREGRARPPVRRRRSFEEWYW